jgi:hypothetical protein
METILNLLMVRFALIVGGLVILALVVFAVALALKRRGRLDDLHRYAEPAVRAAVRHLEKRHATRPVGPGAWEAVLTATLRAAARTLDGQGRR